MPGRRIRSEQSHAQWRRRQQLPNLGPFIKVRDEIEVGRVLKAEMGIREQNVQWLERRRVKHQDREAQQDW